MVVEQPIIYLHIICLYYLACRRYGHLPSLEHTTIYELVYPTPDDDKKDDKKDDE